ncbi:hypothetical protein [Kribbella sp. NPDC055071]
MNRKLAVIGLVGAVLTTVSGVLVEAVVKPRSDVSEDLWSYPWSSDAIVGVSILYAALHILVFIGVLGVVRSLTTRAGRGGAMTAAVGTLVLFGAELASIPIADQRLDQTAPKIVGGVFGLGVALTAVGLLIAGVVVLRSHEWAGWRRYTPLGAGLWSVAMIGLSATSALPVGVAIYGATLTILFAATYPHPSAATTEPRLQAHLNQ